MAEELLEVWDPAGEQVVSLAVDVRPSRPQPTLDKVPQDSEIRASLAEVADWWLSEWQSIAMSVLNNCNLANRRFSDASALEERKLHRAAVGNPGAWGPTDIAAKRLVIASVRAFRLAEELWALAEKHQIDELLNHLRNTAEYCLPLMEDGHFLKFVQGDVHRLVEAMKGVRQEARCQADQAAKGEREAVKAAMTEMITDAIRASKQQITLGQLETIACTLTDPQRETLRAMLRAGAVSEETRVKQAKLGILVAQCRSADRDKVKDHTPSLKQIGLTDSKTGRTGGCWLKPLGKTLAEYLSENVATVSPLN